MKNKIGILGFNKGKNRTTCLCQFGVTINTKYACWWVWLTGRNYEEHCWDILRVPPKVAESLLIWVHLSNATSHPPTDICDKNGRITQFSVLPKQRGWNANRQAGPLAYTFNGEKYCRGAPCKRRMHALHPKPIWQMQPHPSFRQSLAHKYIFSCVLL